MVEDTIQRVLEALRVERDQIERAITALERASAVESTACDMADMICAVEDL